MKPLSSQPHPTRRATARAAVHITSLLLCFVAVSVTPTVGMAGPSSGPQLEVTRVFGGAGESAYTRNLKEFAYYDLGSVGPPRFGGGQYGATLTWPLVDYLEVVVAAQHVESAARVTRDHLEMGDQGRFQWDIFGLTAGLRSTFQQGSTYSAYVQLGAGPAWSRTELKGPEGQPHVEKQLGHQLNWLVGTTFFVTDSLGLSVALNTYRVWAMTNELGMRHTSAKTNLMLGLAWSFGGSAS